MNWTYVSEMGTILEKKINLGDKADSVLINIYIQYIYMYTHVIYKLIFPKTICDMMFMFNHVYDTMLISWFVAIPIMDCENLHYIG